VSVVLIVVGSLASLLAPWPMQILFDNVLSDRPLPGFLDFFLGNLNPIGLMLFVVIGGVVLTLLHNGLNGPARTSKTCRNWGSMPRK
jgi:hypothetical protein